MPHCEVSEWEECQRKRGKKILKSIQFCGLFVVLQQRQKPTQRSPTELQFLSFTFPFFPNSNAPLPPLNCAFSIFYVCSLSFIPIFFHCLLSLFSISPIFSSIFFVYVLFFIFYLVSWRRIACVVSSLGATAGRVVLVATLTAFHSLHAAVSLSLSLSLFTHPLCVDCINLAHVVIAAIDA